MPLIKLSAAELSGLGARRSASPEYVRFLRGLSVGEGGQGTVASEGASRPTIKNRLNRAADEAGVQLKYHRSNAETVIFEVVSTEHAPRRRGRPPKSAA